MGRELMMPDELMRFKFGEGLFMKTRKYPIKANIVPIFDYNIKINKKPLPSKPKNFQIKCFNLDEFRKRRNSSKEDRIELE